MIQSDDVVPIVTLYDRRLEEIEEMKDVPCTVERELISRRFLAWFRCKKTC